MNHPRKSLFGAGPLAFAGSPVKMTGHFNPVRKTADQRLPLFADPSYLIGAAGMEPTTGRNIGRAGDVSFEAYRVTGLFGLWQWNGGYQGPGIGMSRQRKNRLGIPHFDDAPKINDSDRLAGIPYHGQIVRDVKIGEMHLLLKRFQKVEHLSLNRDIQG